MVASGAVAPASEVSERRRRSYPPMAAASNLETDSSCSFVLGHFNWHQQILACLVLKYKGKNGEGGEVKQ